MNKFSEIEKEVRKIWKKHSKEIEKAVQDNPKKPLFSFLEGPPTANAPPGLHHLEARTFKDIICKFKFMKGFSVPRKGGWDCHGLPVEVQVEKKLKLKDKKEVEEYGVEKFTKHCREDVFSNIKDWNDSTEELGYWIDLESPYITLNKNYMESVWWSLKELYKKGLLYEGYKVVPFCPRCGTPLSSHEVAQGYKDIKEDSVYIAFKLKGKKGEYILAWTTTPWTLPGNVALAVNPKVDYVKVQLEDGDSLIVGKEKLDLIKGNYKILEEIKGKELVGLEYEPLYDIPETQNENSHKVISADFVTTEDGTGVVHTAVMYGEDDYIVGKAEGLPEVHTVGQDGKFLDITPEFLRGKFVKNVEKDIIEDLKKRHLLFKLQKFEHSYPFCWRCDSPLLYYGIDSWFVKVTEIRDKIIKKNKKINWYPEHIKEGRFGNWLEGAKDWSLSRFKFWGTPLPVWKCSSEKCNKEKIIGSIEELKKEAVNFPKVSEDKVDLHRSFVDKIRLKCKCGKEMTRIKDVIDCWYDSGSASFAQFHYPFENKKEFEKRFPYDFIAEGVDQTRGWFYTLHVLASALFEDIAYKNVICMGHVVDENGEKMSKTKGNMIKPREIIDQAGVDAVRLQFCTTDVGNSKRFSYALMKESVIPFLTILENTRKYYSQLEDVSNSKSQIEDKWILSKLNSLIKSVEKSLENYSLDKSFLEIMDFVVNDFSRGYIRLTRDREDTKKIVGEVLEKVSLILAPFAPYISEHIYQEFHKGESVHLASWPKLEKKKIDEGLEAIFDQMLKIVEAGLRERDRNQVGLKWPLSKAEIFIKGSERFKDVEEIIKAQLNVKKIEFSSPAKLETEFGIELDFKLNPELEAEGYAREISRKVQAQRKKSGLKKNQRINLKIDCSEELINILNKNIEFIKERTNSSEIKFEKTSDGEEFKIKKFQGKSSFMLD
jgi:isoleucyl-tRNA synthetase